MPRLALSLTLALTLAACGQDDTSEDTEPQDTDTEDTDVVPVDADGDGSTSEVDCDDANDARFPGNVETCDAIDNDCDGTVDDEAADATAWYADADADGYGDDASGVLACGSPTGSEITISGDCDDTSAEVHPGATEICDGRDQDCDPGTTDSGVWSYADGAWSDNTAAFATGLPDAPTYHYFGAPGEVHVCGGPWYASVNSLGTPFRVVGHEGAVLDGAGSAPTVRIYNDGIDLTVEGITLRNGGGSTSPYGWSGGGVYCESQGNSRVTVIDTVMEGHYATTGGGIHVLDCDLEVTGSTIRDNGGATGAGLYAYAKDHPISVTVTDSTIEGNVANGYAGGLFVEGYALATLTLEGTVVRDNSAWSGGGLALEGNVEATCTGSTSDATGFVANTAERGGGVYIGGGDLVPRFVVSACDFGEADSVADNSGGDVLRAVVSADARFAFGDDATFTCGATTCE